MIRSPEGTGAPLYKTKGRAGAMGRRATQQAGGSAPGNGLGIADGCGLRFIKPKVRAGRRRGLGVRQTGSSSPRSGSETVDGLSLRFIKPKFWRGAGEAGALVDRGCSAGWKTCSTGLGWIGGGGWIGDSALLNQRCARGAGGGWGFDKLEVRRHELDQKPLISYRSALLNQSSGGGLGSRGRRWTAVVLQVGKPAVRDRDGSETLDGL